MNKSSSVLSSIITIYIDHERRVVSNENDLSTILDELFRLGTSDNL